MGVASPCQWGMGECWEASGCSLETTPGPGTVLQASWRPARGQSCGAGGTAHVMRWVRESSGVLRLRPRLARYGPSGWPDRSHRWKSVGFSASSSLTPAGQGGGVRGVMTVSRMAWTKLRLSNCLCPSAQPSSSTATAPTWPSNVTPVGHCEFGSARRARTRSSNAICSARSFPDTLPPSSYPFLRFFLLRYS